MQFPCAANLDHVGGFEHCQLCHTDTCVKKKGYDYFLQECSIAFTIGQHSLDFLVGEVTWDRIRFFARNIFEHERIVRQMLIHTFVKSKQKEASHNLIEVMNIGFSVDIGLGLISEVA